MMAIDTFTGAEVEPWLHAVAALRMAVFREWPYLYDGDLDYETKYLSTYAASAASLFVLAFERDEVVGASTGIPLDHETSAFKQAFFARSIPYADVFYFGESVLLPAYRNRGIGHRFFDERERHARRIGTFTMTAFCAVERDEDDPRRPSDYRGNELFWHKRGYERQHDMFCRIDWRETGATEATSHRLRYWLRPLERA
jgi:GNAT superfamily N-acetyltransferase